MHSLVVRCFLTIAGTNEMKPWLDLISRLTFLRLSSDPRFRGERPDPPCGVTESLELIFLICFVCDLVVKVTSNSSVIFSQYRLKYIMLKILYIHIVYLIYSLYYLIMLTALFSHTMLNTASHYYGH